MSMNIQAESVTVEYGTDTVVEIPRLKLTGPGMVALTGPNGAGKSTLLRLFAGLQRPASGTVEIDGVKAHRRRARLNCGFSPDHPVLFDDLTIDDNIAYAHESSGADEPAALATDLIAAFGLGPLLKRFPAQLSRGQQQAASLVVAMSRPVEIMLLDEPALALDADNRSHLSRVLAAHTADRLTVVASHEPELIEAAKRNIKLVGGHVKR